MNDVGTVPTETIHKYYAVTVLALILITTVDIIEPLWKGNRMFYLRNHWTSLLNDKSTVLLVGLLDTKSIFNVVDFLHSKCDHWYDKLAKTLSYLFRRIRTLDRFVYEGCRCPFRSY